MNKMKLFYNLKTYFSIFFLSRLTPANINKIKNTVLFIFLAAIFLSNLVLFLDYMSAPLYCSSSEIEQQLAEQEAAQRAIAEDRAVRSALAQEESLARDFLKRSPSMQRECDLLNPQLESQNFSDTERLEKWNELSEAESKRDQLGRERTSLNAAHALAQDHAPEREDTLESELIAKDEDFAAADEKCTDLRRSFLRQYYDKDV